MGSIRREAVAAVGALVVMLGGPACDRERPQGGGQEVTTNTRALSVDPGPTMSTPRKDFAVVELDGDRLMVIGGSNGVTALSSCEIYSWSAGAWSLARPMSVPRVSPQAVLYYYSGYKILVVGGDSPAGATGTAELYDVSNNTWITLASTPAFHQDFRAWNAGSNNIVLAGGRNASGAYLNTVDVFDMASQTFSTGLPLPGVRAGYGLVTIGGTTYACGGRTSATTFLNDCIRYDSSGTWVTFAWLMKAARADFFSYQDMIFGGQNATGVLKSVELGSTSTGFAPLADMATSRMNVAGDSSSGAVVWLTGGSGDAGAIRASTETVRRPGGGSAFFTPAMAVARTGHGAWMHDDANGIVFGGQDGSGNTLATAEKFNFGVGQWKLTGKPVVARAGQVGVPLGSGDVLLAGGYQGGSSTNVALIFSPSTKNWVSSTTASYYYNNLQIGDGQTAVKLPGNQGVLVTGSGYCYSGGYCYDSYAYSAIYAGGWQSLTSMQAFHRHPAAVLLGTGTVLISGGGQWDAPSDSCPQGCYGSATVESYRFGNWSKAAGMTGRCGNAAAALASPYQDQAIVCGGRPYSSPGACVPPADPQRACQRWNDTTNLGASIAPMIYARADFALVGLPNGKIMATGGGPTTTEIYDPATDTWTAGPAMQTSQTRFGYAWLDATRLLVVNRGVGAEVFTYDPATGGGSWNVAASPTCSETQSNASVEIHLAALGGGQALAVGGNSCPPEIYTLATGAWQALPCLAGSDGFVPTTLDDGTVLLTGGYTQTGRTALASAEVYSLSGGTFKATTSSMTEPRMFAAGATLNDGSALVLGGTDGWTIRSSAASYASGPWASLPALNDCRASSAGSCSDRIKIAVLPVTGDIVVAGGCNFDSAVTTMEVYTAGKWNYLGAPSSLYSVQALHALTDGRTIAVGDTTATRQMSLLSSTTPHVWSPTLTAPYDFEQVNSALLPDGTVFVTGSAVYQTDASASAPVASLYGTSTGLWAPNLYSAQPPDLTLDFFGLQSGSVFRMKNDASTGLIYSFAKDTWLTTNSTNTYGSDGTLTLLANGKVLLVRGSGNAELYTEDSATSGQPCDSPVDCPSTAPNCVDHLCCNSACTDSCHSCALPGFEGRCTLMPKGSACRGIACHTCDGAGTCSIATPSVPCDDGDPQTFNDTCTSGASPTCSGTRSTCRATSQCEASVSYDGNNNCVFIAKPPGTPCDDGNNCTENEACNGSIGADLSPNRTCLGGTMKTCTPSSNSCVSITADCTANVFTCKQTIWTGSSCNDGNACTSGDKCDSKGNCTGTPYQCTPNSCDISASCDGAGGCARSYKSWGTSCDDGDACTDNEYCNGSGSCGNGTLKTCPVSNDPCVSWVGQCTNGVLSCTQVFHSSASCDDGNACTFNDKCDAAGLCQGTAYRCDANSCQQSSVCDGAGKCTVQNRPQGTACDDGVACTQNDMCDGKGVCAGSPYVCPLGECDQAVTCNGSGGCKTTPKRAGTLCRESAGDCDVAETCDGVNSTCPTDRVKSGAVCRPSAGPCDLAEACDGSNKTCPADTFVAAGSVCRNSTGPCDLAETCTGYSAACPADTVQAAGTQCRAANGICDKAEVCDGASKACPLDGYQPAGTSCRASAGDCDLPEVCTGSSPTCPSDAKVTAGTVCRAAAGDCDAAEVCDGANNSCPTDLTLPQGRTCRPSAGPCDVAEVCNGASKTCPSDGFVASGTTCRVASDVCDVAEVCTGYGAACPTDAVKTTGTQCRAASGPCDRAEQCDGASKACPMDSYLPPGTLCRASAGPCDIAETCTGTGTECPADAKVPTNTVCRAAAGDCDVAEVCDGQNSTCPNDVPKARGTVCRASAGDCDVDEVCDGSSRACPADARKPLGTICRASGGDCDVAETCDGVTPTCPNDWVKQAGTGCRASAGDCDDPEYCNGASKACPPDTLKTAGTECRPATGPCDRAEACTGTSATCPFDQVAGAGVTCRPAAGECDVAETCNGMTKDCPPNSLVATGTVCRKSAGACDIEEACDGKTPTCPPDYLKVAGDVCRAAVGPCDRAEACDGKTAACPVDVLEPSTTLCRPATGDCDLPETCTGSSVTCPADVFAPRTTVCRKSAGDCDIQEACTGLSRDCPANQVLPVGTECRPASDKCDVAESCDGIGADCPKDVAAVAGTECRPASGICDRAEVCTGLSKQCPADDFKPAGVLCRSAEGPCDRPESCTGLGPDCPADTVYPIDHVCRSAAGPCDTQELCDGKDIACPPDAKLGNGTLCRQTVGDCDQSEFCDGRHDECPADLVAAAGTVCRAANGECDTPEACNGRDPICPPDSYVMSGITCRPSQGECDLPEACTGSSPRCPADAKKTGTICRAANGTCDRAEVCDGIKDVCPPDGYLPAGWTCNPAKGDCDLAEVCTGSSPACPADIVKPADTVCREKTGGCDVEERCDGTSRACPLDSVLPKHTECRAAGGACDVAESCDGSSHDCPVDVLQPPGLICRPSAGVCDPEESCTGTSPACPDDVMARPGTVCRKADGPCDRAETCTGASPVCPVEDKLLGPDTVCRPAAGLCDREETCTGVSKACPVDELRAAGTVCRKAKSDECDFAETCDGLSSACPPDVTEDNGHVCSLGTCLKGECQDKHILDGKLYKVEGGGCECALAAGRRSGGGPPWLLVLAAAGVWLFRPSRRKGGRS